MTLEQEIKDFALENGAKMVGIAGPERLSGPPSMDPGYTLRGARSSVTLMMPMNVPAIYDFLGKVSPAPHNIDQLKSCQRMFRLTQKLARFIEAKGHKARVVPPNNTYRRAPDIFANRPSFSHRFAAAVSGIGGFGLSGNLMTKEYGAAIYLGSVVTTASLLSDEALPARHFVDNHCATCKLCDKACPVKMFEVEEEEYLLINGELHARSKRKNIDLCNASCFGLHGLSMDKKWSSWGRHWVNSWVEAIPDHEDRQEMRKVLVFKGAATGDSAPRYDVIRRQNSMLWPKEEVEDILPEYEDLPAGEKERYALLRRAHEAMGVKGLADPYVLTCGQCSLVCGPDIHETKKRFDMLTNAGIVVPGPAGEMVHAASYEQAVKIRSENPLKVSPAAMMNDAQKAGTIWTRLYFGLEPKSEIQGRLYNRRLKKAAAAAGLAGREARPVPVKLSSYFMQLLPRKLRKRLRRPKRAA